MNSSVYSADRATYLKVVIVALLASTTIVALAISARLGDDHAVRAINSGYVWKAELPNHNAAVTAKPNAARPI